MTRAQRSPTTRGGSAAASNDTLDVVMLRALAHPVRLGIMHQLAAQPEICACDFTEVFAVRQPTISQHLKVLRDAGLVQTRRRGTKICYSIQPASLAELQDLLASLKPGLTTSARDNAQHTA